MFMVCSKSLTASDQSCFILFDPQPSGENMTEHHTLSDRLRARARQLGVSPAHVAAMAGVNRSFVYDILRGRSARPGLDKLGDVARLLKVDRDWLLHGIGEVEGPSPVSENPGESFVAIPHASP